MDYKANYTLVGLFVMILGTILLAVALWLSVGLENKTYDTYEIFMNEPVSGLSEQAPVKFNGVSVGSVHEIHLNKLNPQQVSLIVEIERGTPITTATVATLMSQGITGITYIGLRAKKAKAPHLVIMSGQKYPIIPSEPSLLVQLDKTLNDVVESVKSVATAVNKIISPENREAIDHILRNVDISTAKLPAIMDNFNHMSKEVSKAGGALTTTMQQGSNALDDISQQAIPPTVSFLDKLNTIAANIEQLSSDLKQNPSVILSGKSTPKLGPGER